MTTSCEEDAALTGPVSLFCGVETWNWNLRQFLDMATWARGHGVSTLFIKVSEVGSNAGDIWYGGFSAWDVIYQELQKIINIIPYSFPYGDKDMQKEISIAIGMLRKYGKFCLDMEGARWSTPDAAARAKQFADALAPMPGKLWLSCPADPVINNQLPFLQAMSPATNVWMPMIYDDHLAGTWQPDFRQVNAASCLQPTLDLSQEFGANNVANIVQQMLNNGIHAISFWYEGFAKQNPNLLDALAQEFTKKPTIGGQQLKLNTTGTVVTTRQWYQLSEGEQRLCGPASAIMVNNAVEPGKAPRASSEDIDAQTDDVVQTVFKTTPAAFGGVSPQDMYNLLVYIRDKYHNIHFQVVSSIDQIDRAVKSGYPCIASCNEWNVDAFNKQRNAWEHAYPWMLSDGHVFPVTGIEANTGNWIVADPLNNSFQGYWPVIYRRSGIAQSFSWGCIVKLPFLAPIPDLNNWPANFNAQNFGGQVQTPTPPQVTKRSTWLTSGQEHQADLTWAIGVAIVPILFPKGADGKGTVPAQAPADNSGIKNDWKIRYMNGLNLGYATTPEIDYVGWDDKSVKAVWWSNGYRTEWNGSAHVYDQQNQRIVS